MQSRRRRHGDIEESFDCIAYKLRTLEAIDHALARRTAECNRALRLQKHRSSRDTTLPSLLHRSALIHSQIGVLVWGLRAAFAGRTKF
jgi:hypothetical protein